MYKEMENGMFKLSLSLALAMVSTALLAGDVVPTAPLGGGKPHIPTYVVDPNEQAMLQWEKSHKNGPGGIPTYKLSAEERAKQEKAEQDQGELIALYKDIVSQQTEDPEHGYGSDMHAVLRILAINIKNGNK
jgi:hypothetical protein